MQKWLFPKSLRFHKYATLLICALTLCAPWGLLGQINEQTELFESANRLYQEGKYFESLAIYQRIDSLGFKSGEFFYNYGNAAFKSNKLGLAIFSYERARNIFGMHNDEDTEVNLELANLRTIDKLEEAPRSFFNLLLGGYLNFFSLNGLAILVVVFTWIFLAFLFLEIKRWMPGSKIKRIIFRTSLLIFMMLFLLTFLLKQIDVATESNAIILEKSVSLKSEPNPKSQSVFVVHEGLKVGISRKQDTWAEVRLRDGNKGWIELKHLGIL